MTDKRWTGCTVACIASGSSLTARDCDLIRDAGLPTIAVNTSWKLARFAQVLYAGDAKWWHANIDEIDIEAERWTSSEKAARKYELNLYRPIGGFNSGLRAIQLASELGASKIILLGYDCSVRHGSHWHGDHAKTSNPDAKKCKVWHNQFRQLAVKNNKIINCSRYTALDCFTKMTLEDALH